MVGSIATLSSDAEGMLVGPVAVADAGLKSYQELKESGVLWLGKVPAHWEVRHLGRIGRFFKGGGGTKEDEREDGIPCVRYGDLYTYHRFFITASRACVAPDLAATVYTPIRYGDVLFAGSGETIDEIGKSAVNLIRGPACCGGDVIIFRPSIDAEARFLGYAADCSASVHQKACIGRGFTVMHIYSTDLKYMAVAIPPVPEQAAIVRFLDHTDRRIRRYIRAKQKLITLLEEQKQAITHRAVTRGLDPNVRLKPSGVEWLGDVPEHWEIAQLGRLIDLLTGFPFKSEGFTQDADDIRLLRGANIAPGKVRWNDIVRWPIRDRPSYLSFELHAGDIVLGMDRPIIQSGVRVATIEESDLPSLLLQRVACIRPEGRLRADFLILLLAGKSFSAYLTPIFTGISVPHLSPEQIRLFRFALPAAMEQEKIVEWTVASTKTVESAVKRAHREIALLGEYRTRLIADVVTGKFDVREAAARLSDEVEELEPLDEADALIDGEEEPTDALATAP